MQSGMSTRTRPMPSMHSLAGIMRAHGMGYLVQRDVPAPGGTVAAPAPPPPQSMYAKQIVPNYAVTQGATTVNTLKVGKVIALTPAQQLAVAKGLPITAVVTPKAVAPVASSSRTLLIAGGAVGLAALAAFVLTG